MKLSVRLISLFLGIVSGVLCAELLARFLFPSYQFQSMVSCQCSWDMEHTKAHRYRPSGLLGYELIPNSYDDINAFGMRDKEYSLNKPAGTFRILLLGDSICELGHWHEYVEDMLNTGGKYEILNAGTSAWGMGQYYFYLKDRGMRFQPDMVLLGLCLNDVRSSNIPVIFSDKTHHKINFYTIKQNPDSLDTVRVAINPYLFEKSCLYRIMATRFFKRSTTETMQAGADSLLTMKKMMNGRLCAVIFPYLKPLAQYDKQELAEYRNTIEDLSRAGVPYLDLTPSFNSYGDQIVDYRSHPPDKIHFNDKGNRIKAALIYPWIKKEIERDKGAQLIGSREAKQQ